MGAFDLPEYSSALRTLEDTKRGEKWARKALETEAAIVAGAMNGTRNAKLNNAALKLGHKVASGYLQAAEVEAALMEAAQRSGLAQEDGPDAVRATIKSGLTAGLQEPEHPQDRPDFRPVPRGPTFRTGRPAAPPQEPVRPELQDSAAFCAARTPADYLIDGSVRDGWLYTLTAPTGHGKSAVALAIAYAIAKGGFLGSNEVKQGSVLFLAGENADDIRERWIAICERDGVDPAELPVTFMPGVWDLKGSLPVLREYFQNKPLRLVVVDTLAAFFDGDNENDNAQQQEFATRVLRPLTELPGRPAAIVPAHPTKGAGKDSLTPKGGSSLLNAVDGNLSAWNTDGTVKVHWQGKFRGAPWRPMHFELSEHESDQLRDSRGRIMPTVVARAMLDSEIGKATEQAEKVENQVLKLLQDGLSIRDIAEDVVADGKRGISKGRVERVIKSLAEQRWIAKSGRKWALTTQGIAVLKQAGEGCDADA